MPLRAFSLLALFALAFPAVADDPKKPTDADINRLLVGKWNCTDPDVGAAGTIRYTKDGNFTGDGTVKIDGQEKIEVHFEGTWSVSKGTIVLVVTKSSRPGIAPVGSQVKETVVAIDQKTLRFIRGLGKEKTRTRMMDE
jgi:hypothetical protein